IAITLQAVVDQPVDTRPDIPTPGNVRCKTLAICWSGRDWKKRPKTTIPKPPYQQFGLLGSGQSPEERHQLTGTVLNDGLFVQPCQVIRTTIPDHFGLKGLLDPFPTLSPMGRVIRLI